MLAINDIQNRLLEHECLFVAALQIATVIFECCCNSQSCNVKSVFITAHLGHDTAVLNLPISPTLPFSLAQNLSSKRTVPTNNMEPKSDNAKRCHWLLKS